VALLMKANLNDEQLVEQLYRWSIVRNPEPKELEASLQFLRAEGTNREEAAQDLLWVLLNSRDFTLVH